MTDIPSTNAPSLPVQQPAATPAAMPAATPTPAATPAATPAPLSPEAARMHLQFQMLDPNREAVGLNTLRPFYKRVGWDVIFGIVHELEAANLLTKKAVLNAKGSVGYHVYTWQEEG